MVTHPRAWKKLQLLERLELICRALELNFSRMRQPATDHADLPDVLSADHWEALRDKLATPRSGPQPPWIESYRQSALGDLARVEQAVFGVSAVPEDPALATRAARARLATLKQEPPISETGIRFLCFAHNLLLLQRHIEGDRVWRHAVRRSSRVVALILRLLSGAARVRAKDERDMLQLFSGSIQQVQSETSNQVSALESAFPDVGDLLVGFFALTALRFLILAPSAQETQPQISEPDVWRSFAATCAPEVCELLRRLAAKYPELFEGSDAMLGAAEIASAPEPIAVRDQVREQLTMIEEFSSSLVRVSEKDLPEPDPVRPFLLGEIGREAAKGFLFLDSPSLPRVHLPAVTEDIVDCLNDYERSIVAGTVAPRPRFYNEFSTWAQNRFFLFRGDHFPLSGACLVATCISYNAVFLELDARRGKSTRRTNDDPGGMAEKREKAQRMLDRQLEDLANMVPRVGDMLAIDLMIAGIKRVVRAQTHRVPNSSFVEDCCPSMAEAVKGLAAKSPLCQILSPAVERLLVQSESEDGSGPRSWMHLAAFLDDRSAGPLRQLATRELLRQAFEGDAGRPLTVVRQCLGTGTIGGALFAGEFFAVLFRLLLDGATLEATERQRGLGRTDLLDEPTSAAREIRHVEAVARVAEWLFCFNEVTEHVLSCLVELLLLKSKLDRQRASDLCHVDSLQYRNLRILGAHWHEISQVGTRGLREHAVAEKPHRMLECFWLAFCHEALKHQPMLAGGLDTGSARWDDLGELGSRLWLRLARSAAARRRREEQRSSIESRFGEPDAAATDFLLPEERGEVADFEKVQKLVDQIVTDGGGKPLLGLQRALFVRQLLVRDRDGRLITNPDKVKVAHA